MIAGNDISTYSIVYPAGAKYEENAYFAADTLRKFIKLATGVSLTVVAEATTENVIEMVDVTTIEGLEDELEIENYKYEVVDGDLLIYGTRRGNMYAVYEILEEYLGYRFYSDELTHQYADRAVNIDEDTEVFHDSYLKFRICKQAFWRNDQDHYFPRRLNGSQHGDSSEALGTLTGPHFINAHSYGRYWQQATGQYDVNFDEATGANRNDYEKKYNVGEVKPEYGWNPCFTDDWEYATLFRGLLETMRWIQGWHTFREETSSISFSICDNRVVCPCPGCTSIAAEGLEYKDEIIPGCGTTSLGCGEAGLNLYIANRACRDIKEYYGGFDEELGYYVGRPAGMEEYGDYEYSNGGYGEAIKDAYPFMDIYTILYDHTMPHELLLTDPRYEKIRPEENLTIMFCGNPCNNHYMGANECNGNRNALGDSGEEDADAFAAWGDVTKVTGSEMWFWYYPVNYNTYVTDSPNIFNIWYDFKYVIEECNVSGIYYEGAGRGYLFENLKAHLAAVFMWSMVENEDGTVSYMSYDEFIEALEEYLKLFYGAGWEYVYEYICMQDEAGNVSNVGDYNADGTPMLDENGQPKSHVICYINNLDYMGDMFDYEYSAENYLYMRDLILKGMALASDDEMYERYQLLLMNCDVIGLSAVRKSWYLAEDADPELKEIYVENYTWVYNFLKDYRLKYPEHYSSECYDRIVVNANYPTDWMDDTVFDPSMSIYGIVTGAWSEENGVKTFKPGGETWRMRSTGWEWTGSLPNWGYAQG